MGELLYNAVGAPYKLFPLLLLLSLSKYLSHAVAYVLEIAALTDDVSNQRCAPRAAKLKNRMSK
ncbi:hypothetical protein Hanom_Chr06g00532501 [Helianthus anomalus]